MFKNRTEAGLQLAEKLKDYSNNPNTIVVTIPRGGLPLGFVISKKLNLPLELVLSKKIGHPLNKECAIGAVTVNAIILSDNTAEVPKTYIEEETNRIRELLKERYMRYYGSKTPITLHNKIVIIIDDGVATGHTLISSINLISRQKPAKIIVGLPVGPPSTIKKIDALPSVNKTICLLTPNNFGAVGLFYENFDQVTDNEVIRLLKEAYITNK